MSSYWFPDATRYIGYNPYREEDRTIHEFPCYSFVLGDLHAHVVNIIFVLLVIALLYVWLRGVQQENRILQRFPWKDGKLLEEAASDASSSGDQCASWNVPVDKLLGFCDLLCGDPWNCAFCQYYPVPGQD